jgi:hypothetical protein
MHWSDVQRVPGLATRAHTPKYIHQHTQMHFLRRSRFEVVARLQLFQQLID